MLLIDCFGLSVFAKPEVAVIVRTIARFESCFGAWLKTKTNMNETQNGTDFDGVKVHNFSEKILEQSVHFHVMKLSGGFFLWVGSAPVLSNLAVSMNSRYVSNFSSADIKADVLFKLNWRLKASLNLFLSPGFCATIFFIDGGSIQHRCKHFGTEIR